MYQGIFLTIAVGVLGALSLASNIFAQEDAIGKRKAIMGANTKAVAAIGNAVKEKDFAAIELKAKEIMENLDAVAKLFPAGSTSEKSRAHPDIWVKTDEFKNRRTNALKAAEALSKAAAAKNEAEVNTKVKDLGNTREGACGECHKVFRADFRKDS